MPPYAVLIVTIVAFVIATVPVWPYSRAWGLWPSGVCALLLLVLVGLLIMG